MTPSPVSNPAAPGRLASLALQGLKQMQLPDGLFCLEVDRALAEPIGRSVRYSLMVAIGLRAASAAGYKHAFDQTRLQSALFEALDADQLKPGDFALYVWLDGLSGGGEREALLQRLAAGLDTSGGIAAREAMEVAWIVQGLAPGAHGSQPLLSLAVEELLRRQSGSGLIDHYGRSRLRHRFPNFATQIYTTMSLATVAKLGLDPRAAGAAVRIADQLISLQLEDGGWPWLYDSKTGRVVEPYEIYSVHQHAMAPMALLQLAEATGEPRFADAALRGLTWISGANARGISMIDEERQLVWRSLRRPGVLARLTLGANVAGSFATGRALIGASGAIELNATCRPYELGWLLEAWCGREQLVRE